MRFDNARAAIYGFSGTQLTEKELAFFKQHNPLGFILFARNIDNPAQVKALVQQLFDSVGRQCPILIDQEGGRVSRLNPPHWPAFPAMDVFAKQSAHNLDGAIHACYDNAVQIGKTLQELGINVDCAPVCDLLFEGMDAIVGDRSFGSDVNVVFQLADAMAKGLIDQKVLPIMKHIPGHGRATCDSHKELPIVSSPLHELWESDFKVFEKLTHIPWAMTAHIVYQAIDAKHPATQSPQVVRVIREEIGFDGVLISDDLSMEALQGDYATRTTLSLEAGCDVVLHCNGNMAQMQEIAAHTPTLTDKAKERLTRSFALIE